MNLNGNLFRDASNQFNCLNKRNGLFLELWGLKEEIF